MKKYLISLLCVFVLVGCSLNETFDNIWGSNLLINGDFEDGQTNWTAWSDLAWGGEGSFTWDNGIATVFIDKQGVECWAISMLYKNITIEKDQTYKFKFRAKSDDKRVIRTYIGGKIAANPPYLYYQDVELETEWNTYSFEFDMNFETDNNAQIHFHLGNNFGAFLPDDTEWTVDELLRTSNSTVYIDDVELVKFN